MIKHFDNNCDFELDYWEREKAEKALKVAFPNLEYLTPKELEELFKNPHSTHSDGISYTEKLLNSLSVS